MAKIKAKRGPEANLGNITLDDGEFAVTTDTKKLYVGVAGVKICLGGASSLGDMLKSIYDTNNDGIVDNSDKLDGLDSQNLQFYQSIRDFVNGTLIQTDIDYSVSNGDPFLLEIEGNSYGSLIPFDIKFQGYIYNNTVINYGGISNGTNISGMSLFNYNNKLCFWFPRQTYWQGFNVFVNSSNSGVNKNRIVSVSDLIKPSSITKEVTITLTQSWNSSNLTKVSQLSNDSGFITSSAIPTTLPANGGTSATCSGNSATASKLATARTINGVSFDGSINITIKDDTKVPKGCTWNDLEGV